MRFPSKLRWTGRTVTHSVPPLSWIRHRGVERHCQEAATGAGLRRLPYARADNPTRAQYGAVATCRNGRCWRLAGRRGMASGVGWGRDRADSGRPGARKGERWSDFELGARVRTHRGVGRVSVRDGWLGSVSARLRARPARAGSGALRSRDRSPAAARGRGDPARWSRRDARRASRSRSARSRPACAAVPRRD